MTSWWRKICEDAGFTDGTGSWARRYATGAGITPPATGHANWPRIIATDVGVQQDSGSWARRMAPTDVVDTSPWPEVLYDDETLSGFTPQDVSGLVAWYDPSDLSSMFQDSAMTTPVTANNDPVGAIRDKSGNGNHLLQATAANRPLYKTSGGLSWLEFDGTNDSLADTFTAVAQPFDRVSAFRLITAAPTDYIIGAADDFCILGNDGTNLFMYANGGFTAGAWPPAGVDFVATERYDGGASSGVAVDTGAFQGAGSGGVASSSSISLAKTNGTGDFANIRFYGLAQYNLPLTDTEIENLRIYYAAKQGRDFTVFPYTLASFAWYDPSDITTLFQDSTMTTPVTANNDPVGAMLDKSGNGHHLIQSTAGARPLYKTSGGLHWLESASSDFLVVTRTLTQPFDRYGAWRIVTLADATDFAGGGSEGNFGALYVGGTATELRMYAGAELSGQAVPAQGVDFVATERYNGASSRIAVDNGSYVTGDPGAGNPTALHLFSGDGSQFIVARCYGFLEFDAIQTDADIALLRTYIAAKQGRIL